MKTQNEFLEVLEEELRFLKKTEINDILKHYRERINTELDYGTTEEKIIKDLPLPKDIADNIYKTKGLSYLEIQKKKYRKKEILDAITSGIVMVFMGLLFIILSIYAISVCININSLLLNVLSFKSIIDTLLTTLVIVILDLVILVIYIYVFDLFYLIITHFLVNILKAIKKTYKPIYKFASFSINGFLKEKAKGKKVSIYVLLALGIALTIASVSSFFTKSYLYRSLSNYSEENIVVYEYDANLKNIIIKGTNAKIDFIVDSNLDKIKVEYLYEFTNNTQFNLVKENTELEISGIDSKTYGVFGLLNEPTQVIIVTLPNLDKLKLIQVEMDDCSVLLNGLESVALDVVVDSYTNEVYLNKCLIKSLTIKECYKTVTKAAYVSENENDTVKFHGITNVDITANTGSVYMEDINVTNFKLTSTAVDTRISHSNIDNFNIENNGGSIRLVDVVGHDLNYVTNSSKNELSDLQFDTINIHAKSASSLNILRIIASKETILKTNIGSNVSIEYFKFKSLNIIEDDNAKGGTINLNSLNKLIDYKKSENPTQENISNYELWNRYNNANVGNTTLTASSTGELLISSSLLDNVNIEQTGKTLQVADCKISNRADFKLVDFEYVKFSKVYGTNIHFVINDTNTDLVYYNDEAANESVAKFYYSYVGAGLKPSTDVAHEIEEVASNE